MLFAPDTSVGAMGANVPGSPIIAARVDADRVTVLMIPVRTWSDGTADLPPGK